MSYVVMWKCKFELNNGSDEPDFNSGVLPKLCSSVKSCLKLALKDLDSVKREIIDDYAAEDYEDSNFFDENATEDEDNDNYQNFLEEFEDNYFSETQETELEKLRTGDELCSLTFEYQNVYEDISWYIIEIK